MVQNKSKKNIMAAVTGAGVLALGCLAGFSTNWIRPVDAGTETRLISYSHGVNAPTTSGTSFDAVDGITNKGTDTRVTTNVSCLSKGTLLTTDTNYYCKTTATYLYDKATQGAIIFKAQIMNLSAFSVAYYIGASDSIVSYRPLYYLYSTNDCSGTAAAHYFSDSYLSGAQSYDISVSSLSLGYVPNSVMIRIGYSKEGQYPDVTLGLTSLSFQWSC